jgi:putative chitinase
MFDFDFTREKLAACIYKNKNPDPWFDALYENLPKFEITTPSRVAGFISQCQHESLDFTLLQENLNYSAKGLQGTFKKYFLTESDANEYQRQPEKIAN